MFGSESYGLVNLLLSKTLAKNGSLVFLLGFLVHLPRQIMQSDHLVVFVHDFATQHINFAL
jgi:hypothetical protein